MIDTSVLSTCITSATVSLTGGLGIITVRFPYLDSEVSPGGLAEQLVLRSSQHFLLHWTIDEQLFEQDKKLNK